MWLIVGLGNKGDRYLFTRHNIGFMAVDRYVAPYTQAAPKEEHHAITYKLQVQGQSFLLAKPQTFMNRSGEAVQALMSFYKIPIENLLVVHDDIDQGFGALKFQKNRGPGGHNGLRSINQCLGTQDYARLKMGVGKPSVAQMEIADFVLQNFSAEEQTALPDILESAVYAIEAFVFDGLDKAANKYNRKALSAK